MLAVAAHGLVVVFIRPATADLRLLSYRACCSANLRAASVLVLVLWWVGLCMPTLGDVCRRGACCWSVYSRVLSDSSIVVVVGKHFPWCASKIVSILHSVLYAGTLQQLVLQPPLSFAAVGVLIGCLVVVAPCGQDVAVVCGMVVCWITWCTLQYVPYAELPGLLGEGS